MRRQNIIFLKNIWARCIIKGGLFSCFSRFCYIKKTIIQYQWYITVTVWLGWIAQSISVLAFDPLYCFCTYIHTIILSGSILVVSIMLFLKLFYIFVFPLMARFYCIFYVQCNIFFYFFLCFLYTDINKSF